MKNFDVLDIHWKIQFLEGAGGEFTKTDIEEGIA